MSYSYLSFFYSFPFIRTPSSYTNSRIVLALPELLQLIGRHIQRSDLLSCIKFCRAWNEILIPELWRTVDTPWKPWSRVCNESRLLTGPREEIEQWFRTAFEQHGHQIRNLKGPWNSAFEAAFLAQDCKNLKTLHVTFVAYHALWTLQFDHQD
ncbi:hypothetical protein BGZ96_012737 [Linnemannia gamsii]|uniref:F-box domain-containing protein n=1 Tax=Linnemannia gamsii TaxID=64522 RepID=A0ABQ7JQA3_9FUNG|nr:hypothetical protein BGZ96_012737 [Linnemannia gamsii]